MWGVLGLGNPGRRYARTRHNLGFLVVDELAARAGATFRNEADTYELAAADIAGVAVLLVKPNTYVNRSGTAARALLARHRLEPAQLLAVVDDVHLPFGRLRLRPSGSAGGHNGLLSIEAALGTREFPRLRIGVGAPEGGEDLADHVLASFTADEKRALPDCIERAADAVEWVLELGLEKARPRINARDPEVE